MKEGIIFKGFYECFLPCLMFVPNYHRGHFNDVRARTISKFNIPIFFYSNVVSNESTIENLNLFRHKSSNSTFISNQENKVVVSRTPL